MDDGSLCNRPVHCKGMCALHWTRERDGVAPGLPFGPGTKPVGSCSECDDYAYARDLCSKHYQRWREGLPGRACSAPGCERGVTCRGLCGMHYQRWRKDNVSDVRRYADYGTACHVDGCTNPPWSGGLCNMHYLRLQNHGDVGSVGAQRVHGTDAERFWPKVDREGPVPEGASTPCWLWLGSKNEDGYGSFRGPQPNAHRMAWVLVNGDIPTGMTIHHKCATPACVNPDHLELATNRDNTAEMFARKALEARISELEAENRDLRQRLDTYERRLMSACA